MFNRKPTRTVVVAGQPIECAEDGAAAIERLQRQANDTEAVNQRLRADQVAVIEAKDAEIAALKADNDRLQASQLKPGDLDRMVDERVQRMADSAVLLPTAPNVGAPAGNPDPVVAALRDGLRKPVTDNGYAEFVARMDYRTNIPRGER